MITNVYARAHTLNHNLSMMKPKLLKIFKIAFHQFLRYVAQICISIKFKHYVFRIIFAQKLHFVMEKVVLQVITPLHSKNVCVQMSTLRLVATVMIHAFQSQLRLYLLILR